MNKTIKKLLSIIITLVLVAGLAAVPQTDVDAATKKVKKITATSTWHAMYVGQSKSIKVKITPSNATNKNLNWTSSKTSVATVSSTGVVTAKKAGTVTITAKAKDGSGKKVQYKITVKKPPVKIKKIKLSVVSKTLNVGSKLTLKATITPSTATVKNLTWTSNKTSVATVNSKGVVTAKKAGTATITAKAKDGSGIKAVCKINVKNVKVSSVKIGTGYDEIGVDVGKTYTLKTTVSPSNATNKALSYSSSNTAVATVNSKGVVTVKGVGKAVITAKAKDGSGKKGTITIWGEEVQSTPTSSSHTHTWTSVYTTIHHDAVTEERWVVDSEEWDENVYDYTCVVCKGCGTEYNSPEEWLWQDECNSSYTVYTATHLVHHEEEGHYETVTISVAYDETVVDHYECNCGAIR